MFAIVRTGGKQYRVAAGDKIVVEKLEGEAGASITLGDILLAGEGSELKSVEGLTVSAEIIAQAKGIAFITTVKAGFVWSGSVGTGIVMAKLGPGRWSGPAAVGSGGMGIGLQVGASKIDSVLVLNNDAAVAAFSGSAQFKLGGNVSVAASTIPVSARPTAHIR